MFTSALTNGHTGGDHPLTLQAITLNRSKQDGFEIELEFSNNVSAVMDHKIPEGTKRNIECFRLFDDGMKEVPIDVIPGNKRITGKKAGRTFYIRPLTRLAHCRNYKLCISKFLQANNYRYLKENHTVLFSTHEIKDISPFNRELCSSYLSLTLKSSSIASGDENVPVDTDIRLTFSNNVITNAVRAHNQQCFSLESSKRQAVEIDVIMAEPDDDSDKKKEIVVRPRHVLQYDTVYVLTISEKLRGGNQKTLGTDKIITFTTCKEKITSGEQEGISIA